MSRTHILCVFLSAFSYQVLGQSVVINEMSQGSAGGKEWVELLVVDPIIDLRGWELGDNDDGNWHPIARFTYHPNWASVPAGTIVVIYNSGDVDAAVINAGGEDTDLADKSVLIGVNNSIYFEDIGLWGGSSGAFANTDGDDCAAIRDSNNVIIHDMAVTHPSATVTSPGAAKVKYYTGNTLEDIGDNSKWTTAASTSGTPGVGNGGDNSTWVDSALPVDLSSWYGYVQKNTVILEWSTDSEIENQGFIIYRGSKRVECAELASFVDVSALIGQGSSTSGTNYSYTDTDVESGFSYIYQLADVDYGGRVNRHGFISITLPGINDEPGHLKQPQAFPNPFNSEVHLSFPFEGIEGNPQLHIYDLSGAPIRKLSATSPSEQGYHFVWDGCDKGGIQASSGIYIARFSGDPDISQRITLIR